MDLSNIIPTLAISVPPILLALTCHEYSHGYVAYRLGDPTAYSQGRLTMNPLKHLDPIGTLAILIIHFGWAKPVPVNPSYFKNPKMGMLWVALAGPMANLALAVATAILLKATILLANNLPDGSTVTSMVLEPFFQMLTLSFIINILLCCFNLIPIPPLDGSRILTGLLPDNLARPYMEFERYGFIVLILLMVSGVLQHIIRPVIRLAEITLVHII